MLSLWKGREGESFRFARGKRSNHFTLQRESGRILSLTNKKGGEGDPLSQPKERIRVINLDGLLDLSQVVAPICHATPRHTTPRPFKREGGEL